MSNIVTPTEDRILRAYLHAKDARRPEGMREAFAEGGEFTTRFNFPGATYDDQRARGHDEIAAVFREMAEGYEDIYTLCTPESVSREGEALALRWLVGMTALANGAAFVAWGDYRLRVDDEVGLATRLDVVMEGAAALPAAVAPTITSWLRPLPAPWCPMDQLLENAPELAPLAEMRAYLGGRSV